MAFLALPVVLASVAKWIAVGLVVRILATIGIAIATYAGVSALWEDLETKLWANLSGGAESVLIILAMARVDDAIQVVLSTAFAVMVYRGVMETVIKRFVLK